MMNWIDSFSPSWVLKVYPIEICALFVHHNGQNQSRFFYQMHQLDRGIYLEHPVSLLKSK